MRFGSEALQQKSPHEGVDKVHYNTTRHDSYGRRIHYCSHRGQKRD